PAAAVLPAIQPLIEEIQNLREGGVTPPEQSDIDRLTGEALAIVENALLHPCNPETDAGCAIDIVPPDARRCFLPKDEPNVTPAGSPCSTGSWIAQHYRTTGTPVGHGFANRPPEAQRNNDGYYAFSPKPGLRFIVLDTITDECGTLFCSDGSVDDTQFQWLRGEVTSAEAGHQYVLVFSPHPLRTPRRPAGAGRPGPRARRRRPSRLDRPRARLQRLPAQPRGARPAPGPQRHPADGPAAAARVLVSSARPRCRACGRCTRWASRPPA